MSEEKKVEVKEEAVKPAKKPRKPREKSRNIEELLTLAPNKLTDLEKNILIKELKYQNEHLSAKIELIHTNANSAYEKLRQTENKFDSMEQFYRKKLQYVDAQLNAFHAAINESIKGGIA